MSKTKKHFYKSFQTVLSIILIAFGISTNSSCRGGAEYGTPEADFIVTGKVESSADSSPIENIKVTMYNDTARTDQNGQYSVIARYAFPTDQTFSIIFTDTDGEPNNYQELDTIVVFTNPEFTGGDGNWDEGETTKTFNVKLLPE